MPKWYFNDTTVKKIILEPLFCSVISLFFQQYNNQLPSVTASATQIKNKFAATFVLDSEALTVALNEIGSSLQLTPLTLANSTETGRCAKMPLWHSSKEISKWALELWEYYISHLSTYFFKCPCLTFLVELKDK